MTRVKDIMSTNVPKVDKRTTVLDATKVMNRGNLSGVVITDGAIVVGYVTANRLLRTFIPLNKKPEDVKVSEVMAPFYRIPPDADAKEAGRKIVANGLTRLGVFDGDRFLGWVSLTDLSRYFSKKSLLDVLHADKSSGTAEFLCPNCRSAFMIKILTRDGRISRWQCPKCGNAL